MKSQEVFFFQLQRNSPISTGRPKEFYIQEALINYFEDLEDLQIALKRLEKDEKTYSSEEVLAKIKSWQKQSDNV